jgi:hypothetical protein
MTCSHFAQEDRSKLEVPCVESWTRETPEYELRFEGRGVYRIVDLGEYPKVSNEFGPVINGWLGKKIEEIYLNCDGGDSPSMPVRGMGVSFRGNDG